MIARALATRPVQVAGAVLLVLLPFLGSRYWVHLGTLVAAFWVLIAGLNLVVGFTGQLSIGHVGLLAVGAYLFGYLTLHDLAGPELALAAATAAGAVCGLVLGLPSLRLPGFYFAMTTLAFTIIVGELAVALTDVTGGGTGMSVSGFSAPMDTPDGQYLFTAAIAAAVSLITILVTRSMWGRAMVSVRDSEVMAGAIGIRSYRVKLAVFTFSGAMAGLAGGLFGALQTYITPETFAFDLSLFFFICIIIGGRGSILGPFIGTVVLTLLPELVSPLAKYGHLFYGVLLLGVILLIPGGVRQLLTRPAPAARTTPPPVPAASRAPASCGRVRVLEAEGVSRSFGAVKALDGVGLTLASGTVHGLIGPNGSGKTTLLNIISGYYRVDAGTIMLDGEDVSKAAVSTRPALGIGRTFQTPRVIQDMTVLDNVVVGGWTLARASFVEGLVAAPRSRADERRLRERALALMEPLGVAGVAGRAANALTHAELRFVEIARALMHQPSFMLLDEPASGLTHAEMDRLGRVIDVLRAQGIGVLLVEHHTDLVFGLSDQVTTLNFGKTIRTGTPAEVRSDPDVRRVYLGS